MFIHQERVVAISLVAVVGGARILEGFKVVRNTSEMGVSNHILSWGIVYIHCLPEFVCI